MLQYFAQQEFVSPLGMQEEPELLYISRTDAQEDALYPRAMHRHDDCFEMLLIEKGNGVISIDGRDYTVHAGDLVLYNCGVMHDEDARPKHRFSRYCIAFGALQLPGMRENCFLPTGACPVLPSGRSFEILLWSFRMIFEMMSMRRSENEAAAHYLALFILSTVGGLCRENAAAGEQVEESSDQISDALKRLQLDMPVAMDVTGKVGGKYAVTSIPSTVIVDKQGKIARVYVGGSDDFDEELRTALGELLGDVKPSEAEPEKKDESETATDPVKESPPTN